MSSGTPFAGSVQQLEGGVTGFKTPAGGGGIMKTTTGKKAATISTGRYADLKRMLEERRKEILSEVQGRIRDQREADAWGKVNEVLDAGESSEADIQEDIEFALIQMKAETLTKINDALHRLEEGTYGYCADCGGEISDKR